MHVQNVLIENAVLQSDEGIDIQEASNIKLDNITLYLKKSSPVAYVLNSNNITMNNVKYADSAELLLQVQGDRSKDIAFLNSNLNGAKQKLLADFGATEATVRWTDPVPVPLKKKNKKK
jgi:DNA sulfur modification protein DndE